VVASTADHYLRDLGYLIRERALKAKEEETNDPGDYTRGQLMAFYEIVSLMQSQAESFSIPWTCLRSTGSIRSETCSKRRAERLALG
jgi:hypothetical protein